MELHAFPVLANLPVNEIGREAVLRVLTPIWTAHPDIARKLRGRIRAGLAWARLNLAGAVLTMHTDLRQPILQHLISAAGTAHWRPAAM